MTGSAGWRNLLLILVFVVGACRPELAAPSAGPPAPARTGAALAHPVAQPWPGGEQRQYETPGDPYAIERRLQRPALYATAVAEARDPDPGRLDLPWPTPAAPRSIGEAGEVQPIVPPAPTVVAAAPVPAAAPQAAAAAPPPAATAAIGVPIVPAPVVRPAAPAAPVAPQPSWSGVPGGFSMGVPGGGVVPQADDQSVHFSGVPLIRSGDYAFGGAATGPFAFAAPGSQNGGTAAFPLPPLPPFATARPAVAPGTNTGATFLGLPSDLATEGGVLGLGVGTAPWIASFGNGMTASVPGGVFANPLAPLAPIGSPTAPTTGTPATPIAPATPTGTLLLNPVPGQ